MPLRVCVHGPAGGTWSGLGDLRVLLVADVLTRTAELQGLQTVTVLAADSPLPAGLDEDLSALGIHRPAVLASRGDAEALLGGSAHVHVATRREIRRRRGCSVDRRRSSRGPDAMGGEREPW